MKINWVQDTVYRSLWFLRVFLLFVLSARVDRLTGATGGSCLTRGAAFYVAVACGCVGSFGVTGVLRVGGLDLC